MIASRVSSLACRRILPHPKNQTTRILPSMGARACLSSSSSPPPPPPLVTTEFRCDETVAVVSMQRAPANAMSLEFCRELAGAIRTVREDHPECSALVLRSGLPSKIFSAGLDIFTELYQPDPDRLPEFWESVQEVFLEWYGCTELTTVAALEGPAPAGGCMLALNCDYRVMAHNDDDAAQKPAVIGLNESQLGMVAPPWMCQQYIDVLGHRHAELALLSGKLFPPSLALEAGLVDELAAPEAVVDTALHQAQQFAKIPRGARAAVKELTRTPLVEKLLRDRQADVDHFCSFVASDKVQATIGRYLEALAAKSKTKS